MKDTEPLLDENSKEPVAKEVKDIDNGKTSSLDSQNYKVPWITTRIMAIIGGLAIFLAAMININLLSIIYLAATFLYLSFFLHKSVTIILLIYSFLALAAKVIVVVLMFATNKFSNLSDSAKDIYKLLGFGFISREAADFISCFLPEVFAAGSLLVIYFFVHPKTALTNEASDGREFFCKLWFWAAFASMTGVYLSGSSIGYCLISCNLVP